jgi:DNA-binding response OmpR family regulator
VVSLRRLRVAVATPDPALTARVAGVVLQAGHDVELATGSPFDAMEAAFSRSIEVLVIDQQLQRLAGTEIASLVRSVGAGVTVVVLHRGELATADDLLVLDPTRPGFEAALANVLQSATGVTAPDRRAG